MSNVDQNAPDRTMKYNGFEYNFNARLPHGITLFGGGMTERMLDEHLRRDWNPNLLLYCDQSQSGLPFRHAVQDRGHAFRSTYGINVGVAFQSLPGYLLGTSAQYALTGVSGPSGITTNNPPNGAGTCGRSPARPRYTRHAPASRRAPARPGSWSTRT